MTKWKVNGSKLRKMLKMVEDLNNKHKAINLVLTREEVFKACDINGEDIEYQYSNKELAIWLRSMIHHRFKYLKIGFRSNRNMFYIMEEFIYNQSGLKEELVELRKKLGIYGN